MTSEDEYIIEHNKLNKLFPNCDFCVCIDFNKMNEIISKEKTIILQYDEFGRDKKHYFVVSGDKLTYEYVIKQFMNYKVDFTKTDHRFLEDISRKLNNNDTHFVMDFGS